MTLLVLKKHRQRNNRSTTGNFVVGRIVQIAIFSICFEFLDAFGPSRCLHRNAIIPSTIVRTDTTTVTQQQQRSLSSRSTQHWMTAGNGFGTTNNNNDDKTNNNNQRGGVIPTKTYGRIAESPIRDMIDQESAMIDFFTTREEWHPIFRAIAGSNLPSATQEFLLSSSLSQSDTNFISTTTDAIPTNDIDRTIVGTFLDSMHELLLRIPVNEESSLQDYDDLDQQFVEEGRRMLAINRFIVHRSSATSLQQQEQDPISNTLLVNRYDDLFTACWNEVRVLHETGTAHSGSIILLPEYNYNDVRRFTDMNLLRPLEWLGLQNDYEIVPIQQQRNDSTPAIRLLYKLNTIPTNVGE